MLDVFEKTKSCLNIIEIAERYGIEILHKNKASCPFHKEKTPSLVFYPKTSSFHCYGCGTSGDLITFVRLLFSLSSNLEAAKKISEDWSLNFFEEKFSPTRKKEICEELKIREKCKFNIELLHTWKNETENSLILMYRTLRDISKHSKRPEDFGSELYAFAQAELFRGEIEDILDFLRCGTNQEIINNYSYIKWYIKDLENRWDKTQKMINGGQKIEL